MKDSETIPYDPNALALRTLMGALNISHVELLQNSRRPEEMIDLISIKLEAFARKAQQGVAE